MAQRSKSEMRCPRDVLSLHDMGYLFKLLTFLYIALKKIGSSPRQYLFLNESQAGRCLTYEVCTCERAIATKKVEGKSPDWLQTC